MPNARQTDLRQTLSWGNYLKAIGWQTVRVDGILLLIRPLGPLGSFIKVQHPIGRLPLTKIDQIAKQFRAWMVLVEPHWEDFSPEPLLKNGYFLSPFRMTHSATIYIDLTQSQDKLWKSLSENARRNIKKAQNEKLIIQEVVMKDQADDQQFRQFYRLLTSLSKLKKFLVPSYQDYLKKLSALRDQSVILFAYLPNQNQPIAAVWLVCHSGVATYLQTGITQEGYQTLANYLLVWEAFKTAKSKKISLFDFEAIYDPRYPKDHPAWQQFSQFKARFHGTRIEYPPSYLKCYSLLFKLYFKCQRRLSKL